MPRSRWSQFSLTIHANNSHLREARRAEIKRFTGSPWMLCYPSFNDAVVDAQPTSFLSANLVIVPDSIVFKESILHVHNVTFVAASVTPKNPHC